MLKVNHRLTEEDHIMGEIRSQTYRSEFKDQLRLDHKLAKEDVIVDKFTSQTG